MGMKNMLAMLCSRPMPTKVRMGKYAPSTLPGTLRSKVARFRSTRLVQACI